MSAAAPTLREQLREWIRKNGKVKDKPFADDTPLVANGILSSLQIMELIFWIERAADTSIDVEQLKPGAFKSVDTICTTFFGAGA
jgi:acyl carrier protein